MRGFFNKKIELGSFTAVILLGVCSGLMFSAFVAGYLSGNSVGFEKARSESIKSLSRFPISGAGDTEISDAEREEIYAKLDKPERVLGNIGIPAGAEGIVENVIEKVDQKLQEKDKPGSSLLNSLLNKGTEENEALPEASVADNKKAELETKSIGDILAENKKQILEEQKNLQETQAEQPIVVPDQAQKSADLPEKVEQPTLKEIAQTEKTEPKLDPDTGLTKPKNYLSKAVPSGWYAQISAPQTIAEANGMAEKLHNSGFPVVIEQAVVNQSTYFRVLVGSEKTRDQALRLVEQLRREPYITTDPFVRRMGS